ASPFRPDVRLIFATNADPVEMVQSGKLRHDLWRRLNKWVLQIPPLRERREDIFLFVDKHCGDHQPTPAFLLCLLKYDWPGYVGELLDVLKLATRMTKRVAEALTPDHLDSFDPAILREVRSMSEEEVQGAVSRELATALEKRGFQKGKGRN